MTQNRPAPAYQEYAAAMLANFRYRTMSLEERGLLYSMRLECWVNKSLPADPAVLARVLGFGRELIETTLPLVLMPPFFEVVNSQIICPELDDYRAHLEERAIRQSEGGKRGADITNSKRSKPKSRTNKGSEGNSTGYPQDTRRGNNGSLVQLSTVQPSTNQSLVRAEITDPWIADYERESNGG